MGDIRLAEEIIYSANPVVNAILKVKSVKAKEKEIPMQVTTLLPQRVSVDIGDMGVLYGNLLDNAIEASKKVKVEERAVYVEIRVDKRNLMMTVSNHYEEERKKSGNNYITTKKEKHKHGFGLNIVRKISKGYNGEVIIDDRDNQFRVTVLLYEIFSL